MKNTEQLNNFDVEAEILASLINSGGKFTERFKKLQPEDFTYPETKTVFELIARMVERGDPVDVSGVSLQAREREETKEAIFKILEKHTASALFDNQLFRLRQLTYNRTVNKLNNELSNGQVTPEEFKKAISMLPIPGDGNLPQPLTPEELLNDDPITSILGNYIIRGALHLISSDPGTGKTTFLYHLAVALSEGREFLGEKLTPLKIAYFDLETPQNVRSKTLQLLGFRENGNLMFFDEQCEIEKLYQLIEKHQIDFLIIDTVSLFFSIKKENDNAEVNDKIIRPLKELTRKTGIAIILVHHNAKASKEQSKTYRSRGASALPGGVDIVINLENTEEENIRKLEVAKNRIIGYNPKLYILKEEGELSIIEKPDSEYTRTQKAEEYILAILERKEAEAKELIGKIDYSRATVYRAIENLLITGKIKKTERGKYRLKNKIGETGETDETIETIGLKPAPEAYYPLSQPLSHDETIETNNLNRLNIFNSVKEKNSFTSIKNNKDTDIKNKYDDTNDIKEKKKLSHETMMRQSMRQSETIEPQGFEGDCLICLTSLTHETIETNNENSIAVLEKEECQACAHPEREMIEYYLNSGISTKRVSEKYGIPQGVLREHMFKHFKEES